MAKDRDLELTRIRRRPVDPPPSALLAWEIDPIEDPHEYAARLRSCLTSTLSIARRTDFDAEEISVDGLPTWLVGVTGGTVDTDAIPRACELGRSATTRTAMKDSGAFRSGCSALIRNSVIGNGGTSPAMAIASRYGWTAAVSPYSRQRN